GTCHYIITTSSTSIFCRQQWKDPEECHQRVVTASLEQMSEHEKGEQQGLKKGRLLAVTNTNINSHAASAASTSCTTAFLELDSGAARFLTLLSGTSIQCHTKCRQEAQGTGFFPVHWFE
ncbi:unnamed protein product, partial [Amoebophrya sp. A25]